MSDQDFFCGNPICKRTSFKREDEKDPWPLRCQVCQWLNVPDEQRGMFREHPKYNIPTLTTVMVRRGSILVAYSTPKFPRVEKAENAARPVANTVVKVPVLRESPRRAAVAAAATPADVVSADEAAPLMAQSTPKLARRRPSSPVVASVAAPSSRKHSGLIVALLVIGTIALLLVLLR